MPGPLATDINSLPELRRHHRPDDLPPWHYRLVQKALNGGKTTRSDLACLAEHSDATTLTISGLDQNSLEFLVERFGNQFTAIHFWKCPRIADLSPLESMPQLRWLAFFWNQRVTRLWDFSRTPRLLGLHFDDFTKLNKLDDISSAKSLEQLVFGNAVWNKYSVDSLEPISALTNLKSLAFNAQSIGDGRIQPLALLQQLMELDFPSNLFSTEQLAWLRARLPKTIETDVLQAFRRLNQPLQRKSKQLDVLICGKGKPFLSSSDDAERLARHVASFEKLVERFAANPTLEPEDIDTE